MFVNKKEPLISVITVCLNSEKTIKTTIESVLHQTYKNYEYIIKDGGSSDSTIEIAEKYVDAFEGKLRIITKKDKCMYDAMNQGIDASRGDVIGIINSDDFYSENTLELVADAYSRSDNPYYIVIGDMERVTKDGKPICRYHFTPSMVSKKECFGHPSMFAAKAVYEKIGLYDITYKLAADGDWQYRAMEDDNVLVEVYPEVFNHMREGGASDMLKNRWRWFRERSRMQIQHKKGNKISIYSKEIIKVLATDVKNFLPRNLQTLAYKVKYKQ